MPTRSFLIAILSLVPFARAVAQDQPLAPEEAARTMVAPEGFSVSLFAGEPDIVQPISVNTDDRGRLWVVECLSYPTWLTEGTGQDRVTILEDADGDGRAETKKQFLKDGTNLTSVAVGFGGVWLCSPPHLIFIPDRDGDDVPDGPAEIVLDGWDLTARHNAVNGLNWGPDGWLYGCNGILSNSRVGPPGTPDEERVALNCGVWRYHPVTKKFEAFAHGTTNPWGVDFDESGQCFITNCVIKHLFHVVPGGHYERMFGQDIMPHSYGLIQSCADHIHWAGGFWDTEGVDKPINDAFGGGHAHSGALVYLGDTWPAEYRNSVFTVNIHGRRINRDTLERHGSGYIARHAEDFMKSQDPWFRGVALTHGPDDALYVADWHDTGECHDYDDVKRDTGRIFKVTYGPPKKLKVDLSKEPDARLVERVPHRNEWYSRHARRLLQERAAAGKLDEAASKSIIAGFTQAKDAQARLRWLWAIHVVGGDLFKATTNVSEEEAGEDAGAWFTRFMCENPEFAVVLAREQPVPPNIPPRVWLETACGLQRLRPTERLFMASVLASRAEVANDPNLPLLTWYAIEPLIAQDVSAAEKFVTAARIPLLRNYTARRLVLGGKLDDAVRIAAIQTDEETRRDLLAGIFETLQGRRKLPPPAGWADLAGKLSASSDAEVQRMTRNLSAMFGDEKAIAELRSLVGNSRIAAATREVALGFLVEQRAEGVAPLAKAALDEPALRGAAIRALAAYDEPTTPELLLARYAKLSDEERADVVATLSARPAFAAVLLTALEQGTVPRADVSPFVARAILDFQKPELTAQLEKVWGAIKPPAEGKAERISAYKAKLQPADLQAADLTHGKAMFKKRCASCHRLFEEGGRIGPELTGAQRTSVDYILENVVDPSAVVPRDFQMQVFETDTGRIINGIVRQEDDAVVTVQTQNEIIRIQKSEIESRRTGKVSMMPEGLFNDLSDQEIRDLMAYLASGGK